MPELAEVEYFRKRWDAGVGKTVVALKLQAKKRVFRGVAAAELVQALTGAKLLGSEARGKQMLFRFARGGWLGIHLGMSGKLRLESADFTPDRHDHLVLFQKERALVYADARMFGRVRFAVGKGEPAWWRALPPALISAEFTLAAMREILKRRQRAPIKAVLLDQACFPGVGNWMADEILWQARLDPRAVAGHLSAVETRALWQKTRLVCRVALRTIGADWSDPPEEWLIHARWKKSGECPRDGLPLRRATVAGRATAWCAKCQPKPRVRRS